MEVDGWERRGHGPFRGLEIITGHHTGTAQTAAGDYPSLRVVRDGRSDLPGPLCNYGLGRSGTIYVVAAGVAWHAGASAYAGFTNLNDVSLGIEAEHAGGILPWTPAQLEAYPRLVGAALKYMNRPASRYCSHRTCALPAGRKPDPKGIADAWMIAQAAAFMSGQAAPAAAGTTTTTTEDDDMNGIRIAVDPSSGEFWELLGGEMGQGSVYTQGWVTVGSAWGDAEVMVTALGGKGEVWPLTGGKRVRVANNTTLALDLKPGTRSITVEGKHANPKIGRVHATYIGKR